MPTVVTVLYPAEEGATFDLDYYLKTHMPLVQSKWGKYGMTGWHVCHADPGAAFSVMCTLYFETREKYVEASKDPATKEVMDDVSNFSNKQPIMLVGEVIANGKGDS